MGVSALLFAMAAKITALVPSLQAIVHNVDYFCRIIFYDGEAKHERAEQEIRS
jgi:hypothetical protein